MAPLATGRFSKLNGKKRFERIFFFPYAQLEGSGRGHRAVEIPLLDSALAIPPDPCRRLNFRGSLRSPAGAPRIIPPNANPPGGHTGTAGLTPLLRSVWKKPTVTLPRLFRQYGVRPA